MYRMTGLFLILIIALGVSAQSVNITGTVSNQSGKTISGAIVSLPGQKLKDTTDSKGAYTLSLKVAVNPIPIMPSAESISLNNGIVSLNLTKPALVRIELFDMRGHLLERVLDNPASAGEYGFDVMSHPLAANMMVIRVSIGRRTSAFRYLPLNNGKRAITSPIAVSSTGGELTKAQSSIDSLKVTASGYMSKGVAITSYQGTVNITLDSNAGTLEKFSFFVTSLRALQDLSKSQNGFGGNFSFGKTGQGAGLLGADSICQCIAERSMPGSKVKQWRAFLSAAKGPDGKQVNAIDRIGQGPWYDRVGRLLSNNITELKNTRPAGADAAIKNDLPNEDGIPNHRPDPKQPDVDNHHFVTGSKTDGTLYSSTATCSDWTSTTAGGKPRCGFSWPRGGMMKTAQGGGSASHWISGNDAPGCVAGIELVQKGGAAPGSTIIGGGGGYGGFYCFALTP